jgi:predicted ArsR family transcriptional regulator
MAQRPRWTFITSHALVLLNVERRPDATVRELAEEVGLTERQVHRVLGDLAAEGYIRRNGSAGRTTTRSTGAGRCGAARRWSTRSASCSRR